MSDFSYLKLYSFGKLTLSQRVQPVDRVTPVYLNLFKTPEYNFSISLIDAIDNFICAGLKQTPTFKHLEELTGQAYQRYSSAIALNLNIHSESQFKEYCQKRYHNEGQKVRIAGICIELKGIDFLS